MVWESLSQGQAALGDLPHDLALLSVAHSLLSRSVPGGSVALEGGNASLMLESFSFHLSILKVFGGTAPRP